LQLGCLESAVGFTAKRIELQNETLGRVIRYVKKVWGPTEDRNRWTLSERDSASPSQQRSIGPFKNKKAVLSLGNCGMPLSISKYRIEFSAPCNVSHEPRATFFHTPLLFQLKLRGVSFGSLE